MSASALKSLKDAMVAELNRNNHNSVQNSFKAIGLLYPKLRNHIIPQFNRYEETCRAKAADETTDREAMTSINQIVDTIGRLMLESADKAADKEAAPAAPGVGQFKGDLVHLNPWMPPDLTKSLELLRSYSKDKAHIERILATDSHVITWAPVLPLTQPSLMKDMLDQRGFPNELFEGYAVLQKQLVVGVTIEEMNARVNAYTTLEKAFADLRDLGARAQKAGGMKYEEAVLSVYTHVRLEMPKWEADKETYAKMDAVIKARKDKREDAFDAILVKAHALAKHLKERLDETDPVSEETVLAQFVSAAKAAVGKQLIQVGPVITHNKTRWVWLMHPKELTLLQQCALGGHFKLSRWTLAFPAA